jgi:hypothetical protein
MALDLLLDLPLVPLVAGVLEHLALQKVGQILLRDPVVAIGVRIEIPLPWPKPSWSRLASLRCVGTCPSPSCSTVLSASKKPIAEFDLGAVAR